MSEHLRSAEGVAREVWQAVADSIRRDDQSAYDAMADVIRAYAAEVREAARAEALAGFKWQSGFRDERGRVGPLRDGLTEADVPSVLTPMKRRVGPWEPTP